MTIDERLERLVERHEALTQTVELLTADIQAMQEMQKRQDARERRFRTALMAGLTEFVRELDAEENGQT